MNTRTLMTVANPIEFDGIKTKADQMRTLLTEPNVKRLKP